MVYDTVVHILNQYELEKFGEATDDTQMSLRRYAAADLLIIDDLGTEMTTAFTQTALYTLINTRLLSKKKMIVSTNLLFSDMKARYTPQLVSRLEGEFHALFFFGEDIRLAKKRRMADPSLDFPDFG